MSIWDNIKKNFVRGNVVTRLIYVNVGLFILTSLWGVIGSLFGLWNANDAIDFLALPSHVSLVWLQPWTWITYMFTHASFIHLLFNMVVLYWFGNMILGYLNEKQIFSIYLLGGISGGIVYLLAYHSLPYFQNSPISILMGASASILALVMAMATYMPRKTINLLFIGAVEIRFIAMALVIFDVLRLTGSNSGGMFAHLGGALWGYLFIILLKKNIDVSCFSSQVIAFFTSLFRFKKKKKGPYAKGKYKRPKTDQEYNTERVEHQKRIDAILDKIKKSGYESLTKEEKEELFNASK